MDVTLNMAVTTDTGPTSGTIIDLDIDKVTPGAIAQFIVTLPGQSPVAVSLSKAKLLQMVQNGGRFESIVNLIA